MWRCAVPGHYVAGPSWLATLAQLPPPPPPLLPPTGNAMLYLTQTYGVGSELQFSNKATIFAQPTARFVSVNGNGRGVTFLSGGANGGRTGAALPY